MYPAIETQRKTGEEPIQAVDGQPAGKLLDFWQWAYSDLVGNTERGAFAEYLVACAIGTQGGTRISWDKYDLLSPEGIALEVKSSGYLQTWHQKKLSSIVFGIQPTYGWNIFTNQYDKQKMRQADIYVFCIHKHKDPKTLDPLDIRQWDFYLMPTKQLNEKLGGQKTISLTSLITLGAVQCPYEELHKRIIDLAGI